VANPNGPQAGTAFFGGPEQSGPFDGLQAEYARVPYGNVGLVKLPEEVSDEQAIVLSDIFPTAWYAADMASVHPGHTVAVFGCGPVGQLVVASLKQMGAGRIFAIDKVKSRLDQARAQGAECIDFNEEDPVEALRRLTNGIGVDRSVDAVGVDAESPQSGPAKKAAKAHAPADQLEQKAVAPKSKPDGDNWHPGDAPSQALRWAIQGTAKAGTLSIVGVYPPALESFPIGLAMNRNVVVRMGNCPHRKYLPHLLSLVKQGALDPQDLISQQEPLLSALDAYKAFDTRQPGWLKVELLPAQH
jgi:threonine dehydrogenase-like Zn-dependent dehydrogenase